MSSLTNKLKLTKPELGDAINPDVFSENFEIIDEHIGALENDLEEAQKELTSTKKTANNAMPKSGGTFSGQTDFNRIPRVLYNGVKRSMPFMMSNNAASFEWTSNGLNIYIDSTLVGTVPRGIIPVMTNNHGMSFEWTKEGLKIYIDSTLVATIPQGFSG